MKNRYPGVVPSDHFLRSPIGWWSVVPAARCGTGSARQAAKNVPGGGTWFSRSSAKSQSSLRASSFAPPVSWRERRDAKAAARDRVEEPECRQRRSLVGRIDAMARRIEVRRVRRHRIVEQRARARIRVAVASGEHHLRDGARGVEQRLRRIREAGDVDLAGAGVADVRDGLGVDPPQARRVDGKVGHADDGDDDCRRIDRGRRKDLDDGDGAVEHRRPPGLRARPAGKREGSSVASSNGPYTGASAATPRTRTATPAGSVRCQRNAQRRRALGADLDVRGAAAVDGDPIERRAGDDALRAGTARPYPIASGLDFAPPRGPAAGPRSPRSPATAPRSPTSAARAPQRSPPAGRCRRVGASGASSRGTAAALSAGCGRIVAGGTRPPPWRQRDRRRRGRGCRTRQRRAGTTKHAGTPRSDGGTATVTATGDVRLYVGRHSINAATVRSAGGGGTADRRSRARARPPPPQPGTAGAARHAASASRHGGSAKPNVRSNLAVASTP